MNRSTPNFVTPLPVGKSYWAVNAAGPTEMARELVTRYSEATRCSPSTAAPFIQGTPVTSGLHELAHSDLDASSTKSRFAMSTSHRSTFWKCRTAEHSSKSTKKSSSPGAPTFAEKAKVFPGCVFLVGVDTIRRISQPIYYGDEKDRDAAIDELAQLSCRFLVFGRLVEGKFQEFSPEDVTPKLAELCDVVSEGEFRLDISSTALRSAKGSS